MKPAEFRRIWKDSKLSADQLASLLGQVGPWRGRKIRRYAEGSTNVPFDVDVFMRKLGKNLICPTCKQPLKEK